jgi:hypothetical protein
MESEGSLQCSEEPSTGSYPEPEESSPYHPTLFRSLSSRPRRDLPSGLFPSGFCTKTLYAFMLSRVRSTYPTQLILLDLIIMFCEEY